MARDGGLSKLGVGSRSPAAWSARETELQALATLAALAQISTPSAAHFLKSHQLLVQKFAADRNRQRSSLSMAEHSHSTRETAAYSMLGRGSKSPGAASQQVSTARARGANIDGAPSDGANSARLSQPADRLGSPFLKTCEVA